MGTPHLQHEERRLERQVVEFHRVPLEDSLAHVLIVSAQRVDDMLLDAGVKRCRMRKVRFEQYFAGAREVNRSGGSVKWVSQSTILIPYAPKCRS